MGGHLGDKSGVVRFQAASRSTAVTTATQPDLVPPRLLRTFISPACIQSFLSAHSTYRTRAGSGPSQADSLPSLLLDLDYYLAFPSSPACRRHKESPRIGVFHDAYPAFDTVTSSDSSPDSSTSPSSPLGQGLPPFSNPVRLCTVARSSVHHSPAQICQGLGSLARNYPNGLIFMTHPDPRDFARSCQHMEEVYAACPFLRNHVVYMNVRLARLHDHAECVTMCDSV